MRKNRTEVLGMLLEEFDAKKYERSMKETGREAGDAWRLIRSVEAMCRNLQVTPERACEIPGVTPQEYETAKQRWGAAGSFE